MSAGRENGAGPEGREAVGPPLPAAGVQPQPPFPLSCPACLGRSRLLLDDFLDRALLQGRGGEVEEAAVSKGRGGGFAPLRRELAPDAPPLQSLPPMPRTASPAARSLSPSRSCRAVRAGRAAGRGGRAARKGASNGDRFLLSREARATLSPLGARPAPLIPPPEAASLHAGSPRTGPDGGGA